MRLGFSVPSAPHGQLQGQHGSGLDMCSTCLHVMHMSMIQIRHVPEDVHRTLKARAAKAGMSLSDYLLQELGQLARKPTLQEWIERVRSHPPVGELSPSPTEIIRELRDKT